MAAISDKNTFATFVLPKTLKARLYQASDKSGAPISAIIRKSLENHLHMLEVQQPTKEAL